MRCSGSGDKEPEEKETTFLPVGAHALVEGTENKEDKHRLGEAHAMEEKKPVEKGHYLPQNGQGRCCCESEQNSEGSKGMSYVSS